MNRITVSALIDLAKLASINRETKVIALQVNRSDLHAVTLSKQQQLIKITVRDTANLEPAAATTLRVSGFALFRLPHHSVD